MSDGHWKRLATSWLLLAVVVFAAGVLLALIGSTVFPQAAMFAWAAIVLLVFLLIQLVVFRVLGLRSRADEVAPSARGVSPQASKAAPGGLAAREVALDAAPSEPPTGAPDVANDGSSEDARDWRAWRG